MGPRTSPIWLVSKHKVRQVLPTMTTFLIYLFCPKLPFLIVTIPKARGLHSNAISVVLHHPDRHHCQIRHWSPPGRVGVVTPPALLSSEQGQNQVTTRDTLMLEADCYQIGHWYPPAPLVSLHLRHWRPLTSDLCPPQWLARGVVGVKSPLPLSVSLCPQPCYPLVLLRCGYFLHELMLTPHHISKPKITDFNRR